MNAALAVIATLLAAGGLAWLEWRRPDRRHVALRIGAILLAVGALALLGWRPTWRRSASTVVGGTEAALWTAGTAGDDGGGTVAARYRFVLAGASAAPADATRIPDAAILRRRFPTVGTLHVHGDGLEPFDLDALRGLRVVLDPAPERLAGPAFSFVRCPRELTLGLALTVQGRVSGLKPGTTATVTLEAPDGATTDADTPPADADGGAGFSVEAAPPPAAGHFVWRLRLGKTDEPLGVAVVSPELPRVLVLLGAPRFDTAALRHWFEAAGGTLAARTLVGQDRYRFESAHDPPPQFTALDASLLAGFDLVMADGRALAALPPPERDALRAAVADTGLGVLVLADEAILPGAAGVSPEAAAAFFPWKLTPLTDAAGEGDRMTRVRWTGQTQPVEIPVPSAPFEIAPQDGQTALAQDSQGHTLAASKAHGRGQVALTLVRETGRWTRENDPAAFAAYWSALFSPLARKTTADAGRWTLAGGDAGPLFVDQPVELVWSGKATPEPAPGVVRAEADADGGGVTLPLAADPGEPGRWRATFWPRRSGWQRVTMPAGPSGSGAMALDFFVHPAGDWSVLDAARRRAATARFAERSGDASSRVPATGGENLPVPAGGWFALFLAGAGYLWIERRRTG